MVHPQLGTMESILRSAFPPLLMTIARTRFLSCGCLPKSIRFSGAMSFGSRPEAEFEATAAFSGFETFSVDLPGGGGSVCTVRGGVVEGFGRASLGCGSAGSAVLLFACWELLFAGAALSSWLAHAEVSAINANRTAYVINIERFIADKFSTKVQRMRNEYDGQISSAAACRLRGSIDPKRNDRSSPAASLGWRVAVINHEGAAREDRSNHFTLNSDSLPVNDANKSNTSRVCLINVVFDYRAHLTGRDRMKIENVSKRNDDRFRKRIL